MAEITKIESKEIDSTIQKSNDDIINQATPLNLNRYVLAAIYVIYTTLTGCIYFGWAGLSSILFRGGAYKWLCDTDKLMEGELYYCEKQDTAVQFLFQIAMASHFSMSAVAGTLIDTVGPRYTAMLGQGLNILAWVLISVSNEHFDAYKIGFVLVGLGADTGFLPVLSGAKLFPKANALVLAIFGAANSASFAVPIVMDALDSAYGYGIVHISYGYIVVLVLSFVCAAALLPKIVYQGDSYHKTQKINEVKLSFFTRVAEAGKGFINEMISAKGDLLSSKYICIFIYFGLTSIAYNFYVVSARTLLQETIYDFYGLISPLSFIPCIAYGYLVDRFGSVFVLAVNTVLGILGFVTGNIVNSFSRYISAIALTIYVSFYTSQMYCFVQEKFNEDNFGKMIGIASACGGILSLTSHFLYDPLTKVTFQGNFWPVSMMLIALLFINLNLLLFTRGSRKGIVVKESVEALTIGAPKEV